MKKTVLTALVMMCVFLNTISVSASENSNIIRFEDGSYITIEIYEDISTRTTNSKSGIKTITHYNNNDEKLWDATIKGTFSYTGSSATCTVASITYNIYNDSWKITSATATKNSNKAIGDITAKHYALGIPVKTVTKTITLTCSATGTLS